jgi:uncharacterized protein YndB with AHSA1/START domain
MGQKLRVEAVIAAPIAKVWHDYTSADAIKKWNAASDDWHTTRADVDLRIGGAFNFRMEARDGSMGFDFAGTYINIIVHKLIEYKFDERRAVVELSPVDQGILVRVTFDAEETHTLEQQQQGWQSILNRFKSYVEA